MIDKTKQIATNGDTHVDLTLGLTGDPIQKLAQGKKAAAALMTVAKPVMIDGRQYLRFEDLQTIGAFFGTIVGTSDPEYVEVEGIPGYKASAVVRRLSDGLVISSASAYCLREGNWKTRENYALASMAQTRAGAKALRNSFAWIAVLAGFEATPAEEMVDLGKDKPIDEPKASAKQLDYILDLATAQYGDEALHRIETHCAIHFGGNHTDEITRRQASELIDWLRNGKELDKE